MTVLAVDAAGVSALIVAVATGIGTIVALIKTARTDKTAAEERAAKAAELADKASVGMLAETRNTYGEMITALQDEVKRLRERAGVAEAEAARCEERCDGLVADLAKATRRIAALETALEEGTST